MSPPPRRDPSSSATRPWTRRLKANPKEFNFSSTTNATPAGWLGVVVGEKDGKPVVDAVAPESPAEAAGLKEGDVVVKLGGRRPGMQPRVRDILRGKLAGDKLKMNVMRGGKTIAVTATLKPASKPMSAEHQRAC